MNKILTTTGVFALLSSAAFAGGLDRSGQSVAVIFEEGSYAEFSLGFVAPDVSGVGTAASPTPGGASGNMADNYLQVGLAYKRDFTDNLSFALILDQPFGADVNYPAGVPYYATGATATLRANALTGVLRYETASNVSVFGGIRYQTLEAEAVVPFVGGYAVDGARDAGVGYLVGAAYERPDIALRVALTYNSSIDHDLATVETGPVPGSSSTAISTPQSVNLEFQSGIAADTLLFGSIRWAEWSEFDITPVGYLAATGGGSLVSYENDTISYSIGVGRRFNENWAGAITLGYEKANGGFSANLGPTDGNTSIGIGVTYSQDNWKIQGGLRYVDIGDADTTLDDTNAAANFTGNSAIGAGIKFGITF